MQKTVEKLIRRSGFLPLLVLLLLISGSFIPNFFTFQNGMNVLRQTTYLAIITVGEMLVFLVGGFDLAIGAVVALTSIVAALTMTSGISESSVVLTILGILGGLAVSTLVGLVNGLTVAVIRVAPFIVTVATMGISSGLALQLAGGTPVWGITKPFVEIFGSGSLYGVPNVVLIAVIILIIMHLLLNMTYLGRYFWAIGGNENAALLSGINTRKYTVLAYTLCGFFSGFTGVLLTARVGAGEPVLGGGLMLQAMAAAVIGGTKVGGGVGNIPGAVLGALFITLVGNAMNLANIGSYVQLMVMGCLLMFAIISDRYVRR